MQKIRFKAYFKERIKDKKFITILFTYLLLCVGSAIYWCIDFQIRNLLMSLLYSSFILLIFFAEYLIGFRCGEVFTIGVLCIAFGSILGSCFNLYTIFPFFDTLLHGLSGVLFGCVGFMLAEKFFGKAKNKKEFFGCLVFAVCFSLAIAVIWEIFEYTCTFLMGIDMMEDAFVTEINSYLLAGSHTEIVEIEGILKTVIYYGNGQTYTIEGYLDLGLIDTLSDMIICVVGAIIFFIITLIGYLKFPKINDMLIPKCVIETEDGIPSNS